jgi:hypothetical protein
MNEEELKRLIQRYYSGESTEEEEDSLRVFFRKNVVPRGYEAEKVIFGYYDDSEAIPEPSHDFEAQILAAIDASEKKTGIRRYMIPVISAAAGIMILFGAYFFFMGKTRTEDTYTDPHIAYLETVKILHDISTQLNRGTMTLEPVGKLNQVRNKSFVPINQSTRIVEKKLQTLQKSIDLTTINDKR